MRRSCTRSPAPRCSSSAILPSAGWISSCRAASGCASRGCSSSRRKSGSGIRAERRRRPRAILRPAALPLSTTTETSMAKAYWVVCYRSIKNPDALAAYAKIAGPAIQAAGGRFLVRGTPAKTYENGLNQRTVVSEFDSLEKAIAAHESPAYQEALRVLGDAADRDLRIVEGVG